MENKEIELNQEDVTFDDFRFAINNGNKELTEEQKQELLNFAKFIKNREKK